MHTMEVTKDKKGKDIVRVIIECPSEVADLGQMELDLSDKTMRLNVPGAQQLVLKFQQKVLSTQAKAKFKKNKSLVVSIPIAKWDLSKVSHGNNKIVGDRNFKKWFLLFEFNV